MFVSWGWNACLRTTPCIAERRKLKARELISLMAASCPVLTFDAGQIVEYYRDMEPRIVADDKKRGSKTMLGPSVPSEHCSMLCNQPAAAQLC
jgi:hypothetical protein